MEREGLRIIQTKSFNILHSVDSATRQIRVAQTKIDLMPSGALKQGMMTYLDELTERVKVAMTSFGGKIPLSYDYIIAAESQTESSEWGPIFSLFNPFQQSKGDAGDMTIESSAEASGTDSP